MTTQKPTPTPEQQPRSYDERNETEKQVRINPTDPNSDDAIKGIDPAQ